MKLKILLTFLFLFIPFLGVKSAYAYQLIKRSDISIDDSISDQSKNTLAAPKYIKIVRVISPNNVYTDSELWVKSLYYYSVTRLGFLDIPYNFLVDRDGKVYQGNQGGVYTDPQTKDKNGVLVIGYLSNDDDLTSFASTSISQIITLQSYTYGIPRKNVSPALMFIGDLTDGIAKTSFSPDSSNFSKSMNSVLGTLEYSTISNQKYSAQVKDVSYPAEVKSTEKFTVDVTYVNKNDFPWFTNSDYIYLSTKGSKESKFAVNGKWLSFSKPLDISDKVIMPGEELKLSFDMQAMLLPGKYTEKFDLLKLPKNVFSNSEFSVSFKVLKGNFKLVKIVGIPSLNVRECIGPSCDVITQVGENQIFIMEEKIAGWYKIRYTDKKTGWVFGQYVEEIQ